jgi:predicted nucleic acid-binding protein
MISMIAFDTNILIYTYDQTDLRRKRIATDLLKNTRDGVLLWQVACEFISASRKLTQQGLTADQAWDYLSRQLRVFPLVTPTMGVLGRARKLHADAGCSFWDAMIFAACLEAGVERIYSEDLPGCPVRGLEIVNPFAS